ncbi:hypothetical protein QT231_03320 [Halomonas sp. SpR1]|uniref:hypothetical protein n=1 Tax=Halomonas sp. SpR1 TaxID=3050462 RepID=UPI0027E4F191|nr:hypothetical protein [Halomonas sp. SpR1]MDQ7731712.1 hypothetical protein [Halomonas sp. SpR1]
MDETTWMVTEEPLGVRVNFDLRSEENCFIELFFTKKDIEQLMHMDTFGKYFLELDGISGNVSRTRGDINRNTLAFTYLNGGTGYGSVHYNHGKLKNIMACAIEKIWKLEK